MQRRSSSACWDSPLIGPIALSIVICVFLLSGFLLGVKGLPWWYQLLVAAAGLAAVAQLWLTFLTDPGALTPAASQDPKVEQLE
ncbi:hypothetical protein OEZ86_006879 [Tetradesmus obliquus]|nr:hypothetical protein OEZ86_006879 [Tetradesmus obliquus]